MKKNDEHYENQNNLSDNDQIFEIISNSPYE